MTEAGERRVSNLRALVQFNLPVSGHMCTISRRRNALLPRVSIGLLRRWNGGSRRTRYLLTTRETSVSTPYV